MSFLSLVKAKFGLNATATDNFVIESTGAGTGRIRKGDLATVGSDVLTIGTGGVNGIAFASTQVPSADPNTLDDYVEYTAPSTACTGALTISVSYKAVKIGRLVTLTLPVTIGTTSASGSFSYGNVLPTALRPTDNQGGGTLVSELNVTYVGQFSVSTAGVITIYRNTGGGGAWGNSANSGIYSCSFSWVV